MLSGSNINGLRYNKRSTESCVTISPCLTNSHFNHSESGMASQTISKKGCSVEGCNTKRKGKGFCAKHLWRFQQNGSPFVVRKNYGEGDTAALRFWSRVALTADPERCWEWQGNTTGYGYGNLKVNGRQVDTHQAAWYFTYGEFSKKWILHSCDNPRCVNPRHLREGTPADNTKDMIDRLRGYMGERHYKTDFSAADVLKLRERMALGESDAKLAKEFNTARCTMNAIRHRRNWKHI